MNFPFNIQITRINNLSQSQSQNFHNFKIEFSERRSSSDSAVDLEIIKSVHLPLKPIFFAYPHFDY